jgi:hypothetical protein
MLIYIGAYKIWDCGNYKFSLRPWCKKNLW